MAGGVADGTGGARDLTDLGFGVIGFCWDGSPGAWGLGGAGLSCGWTEDSAAGRLQGAGSFTGPSTCSTEPLLSASMENS